MQQLDIDTTSGWWGYDSLYIKDQGEMFEVVQIIKDDIYVTFFGTSLLFDCMSVVLVLDSCKRNICAAFAPLISKE